MLHKITDLKSYSLQATDGEIGSISDLYFDQESWVALYLVVDVGSWWESNEVLLVPEVIESVDAESQTLMVNITREQVRNSPDVTSDMPLSREKETLLHRHYGWQPYWTGPVAGVPGLTSPTLRAPVADTAVPADELETPKNVDEPRTLINEENTMRSAAEIVGYSLKAVDGNVGDVEDFIIDDSFWVMRYIIVNTGTWLSGKSVLLAPGWIEAIDWLASRVSVDLTQQSIEHSPQYDPDVAVSRTYEKRLYEHYQKPQYWEKTVVSEEVELLLGKDLIGNPVISVSDGRSVGRVRDIYLDKELDAITGIFLGSEGFFTRKSFLVHAMHLAIVGVDAALVDDSDVAEEAAVVDELTDWIRRDDLQGRLVLTPGGTKIGRIGDVIVDTEGSVAGFGLRNVYVEGPIAENRAIARHVVLSIGNEDEPMTIDLEQAEQQQMAVKAL